MTANRRNIIPLMLLLALLAIVSTVLVVAFTFAGNSQAPDAIATYTQNNLKWSGVGTNGEGVADLNIFGEPPEGETLPLIHPFSKGTYYLRLKNDVTGRIGYSMYFYTDNPTDIPLDFNIIRTSEMGDVAVIPSELEGKQIVSSSSGLVDGKGLKDVEIKWNWDTETDQKDTQIGNKAVTEDLIYTIKVLIVIEDNNAYLGGGASGGGASGTRLLHRHYVIGYPEGDFRPENPIARSEVSAIFARILADYIESDLKDTRTSFPDVSPDSWYAKYVARVEDTDIVNGYPDGKFRAEGHITRAEFATVCVRYFEHRAGGEIKNASSHFTDVSYSHWSKEYVDKAHKQGFIAGYPDGSFKPDNYISRAEVVTIVNRMLSRYPDKDYIDNNLDKLIDFTDLKDNTYWAYYDIFEAANIHHTRVIGKSENWLSVRKIDN